MARETIHADFGSLVEFTGHLRKDLRDASKAMPAIAEAIVSSVEDVFLAQGAVPGQGRWASLTEETKRQRRGTAPYDILSDTGTMRNSIAPRAGNNWAEAFTDVPYFGFHRWGTVHMPRRDPYAIDEGELLAETTDILLAFFRRRRQ